MKIMPLVIYGLGSNHTQTHPHTHACTHTCTYTHTLWQNESDHIYNKKLNI